MQKQALKSMKQLGRRYREIKEFKKIPGIGNILAHIFDAFIQTPDRFANKRQRTFSRVHARLNTQRKIIAVMYGMWKRAQAYRPQLFLDSLETGVV